MKDVECQGHDIEQQGKRERQWESRLLKLRHAGTEEIGLSCLRAMIQTAIASQEHCRTCLPFFLSIANCSWSGTAAYLTFIPAHGCRFSPKVVCRRSLTCTLPMSAFQQSSSHNVGKTYFVSLLDWSAITKVNKARKIQLLWYLQIDVWNRSVSLDL